VADAVAMAPNEGSGNGFNAERIGKKLIVPIEIDIIKTVSSVTEQSDKGEKNVLITDCIAFPGFEIFRKSPCCIIF